MRFHFVLEGRMEIQARMSDCVAVVDLLDAVAGYARLPPPPTPMQEKCQEIDGSRRRQ